MRPISDTELSMISGAVAVAMGGAVIGGLGAGP